MQASAAPEQASSVEQLTRELGLFMKALMSETGRDFFRTLEELSMSITQLKALGALIDAGEPLALGAVSEVVGVSLPAMSRAVEDLRERGFVKREEDPRDRRSKRVAVTPKGRRAFDRLIATRLAGIRAFVERLEPEQRDALATALRPIVRE